MALTETEVSAGVSWALQGGSWTGWARKASASNRRIRSCALSRVRLSRCDEEERRRGRSVDS
jgi:hypothetical protein